MAHGTIPVQVPLEDEAIQRAFVNLDAQMDAWLAAMKRAEQAVSGGSDRPDREAVTTVLETTQAPAGAAVDATDDLATAEQVEPAAQVELPIEPPVSAQKSPQSNATDPESTLVGVEPATEQISTQTAEDEALLASLDAETLQAIRVMRRMCMNKKSVSELLAEHQARKSGKSGEAGAKKSWFRRGK